jgi:uroporphyrinogen decarboxylase
MSKRQRVISAINNQKVDQVPIAFWHHYIPDEKVNAMIPGNEKLIEENLLGHQNFIKELEPDIVKIMSDGFFSYPLRDINSIKSAEDFQYLVEIKRTDPWVDKQIELAKNVKACQKDAFYFYNIFSPINMMRWLVGLDQVMFFIKNKSQQLSKALEVIANGLNVLVTSLINEAKVDGIYYCVQNPQNLSDEEYLKMITPSDVIVLNQMNKLSETNILHICGYDSVHNNVSFFKTYPAKIYNWAVNVEGVTLSQGKKIFNNACVLGGFSNFSNGLIHTGVIVIIILFID